MNEGTVIVIETDDRRRESLVFDLGAHSNYRVLAAALPDEARLMLHYPDLRAVVCAAAADADTEYALLREIRSGVRHEKVSVVLTGNALPTAWTYGADAVLPAPVQVPELVACLRHCVARRGAEQSDDTPSAMEWSAHQTVLLLATLVDASHPGTLRQSNAVVGISVRLAEQFDVPEEWMTDLRYAGMLFQTARLSEPGHHWEHAGDIGFSQMLAASAQLLESIPILAGAGELVAGMGEHWDGTGLPKHRERGQIPMRARILRVAADYVRAYNDDGPATAESLLARSGTLYDPAVVHELRLDVIQQDGPDTLYHHETVPLDRLTEGLVLASDLCTASGVKLLSRGAVLTAANLRVIRERHRTDPIIHGVSTERRSH